MKHAAIFFFFSALMILSYSLSSSAVVAQQGIGYWDYDQNWVRGDRCPVICGEDLLICRPNDSIYGGNCSGGDGNLATGDCGNTCGVVGYPATCDAGLSCASNNICFPTSCAGDPVNCSCPGLTPGPPVCSSITVSNWINPTPLPTATPTPICGGGRAGEPTCVPTQPPIPPPSTPTPIPTVFNARWTYQLKGEGSGGQPPYQACWSSSCTGGAGNEGDELTGAYNPGVLGGVGGPSYPSCGRADCCNPSKAFDGSTTTFWAANPSNTQWNLYYNYGETTPANTEVTIAYYQPYYPGSVTIALSMDAVSWNTVITPTPTPTSTSIRPGDPTLTPSPPAPTPNPTQTFTIIPAHRYIRFTFDGGLPYIREITTSKVGIVSTPIPTLDTRGTFSPIGANPINWTVPYPILATPTPDGRPNQPRTPICTLSFFATDALGRSSNTCSVTGGWVDGGPPPSTPTPSPTPIPMGDIRGQVYVVNNNQTTVSNNYNHKLDGGEKCYYQEGKPITIVATYAQDYAPLGKHTGDVATRATYNGNSTTFNNCPLFPYILSVPKGVTYNVTFTRSDIANTGYTLDAYDDGTSGYTAPGNGTVQVSVL